MTYQGFQIIRRGCAALRHGQYLFASNMDRVPDIGDMPAGVPPPGVIPNFTDPETRVSRIDVSAAVCLPLIIIFASFRLYAKAFIVKKRTWDDGMLWAPNLMALF